MPYQSLSLHELKCLRYLVEHYILTIEVNTLTIDWAEALIISGYDSNNAYILASFSLDKQIESHEVKYYFSLLCEELGSKDVNLEQSLFCLIKLDFLRIANAIDTDSQSCTLYELINQWYDSNNYILSKTLAYWNQTFYYHYDYLRDVEDSNIENEAKSFIAIKSDAVRFYRLFSQLEEMRVPC
ncbi:hypothetical protein Xvie_02859 [Xenorhabdus vietnamensis]|uniref:Uncharacterized protein n=1 Tax=Xenorhabdus vietnamensis TaxID=351656 RepID=A0A1Y2SCV4_9GAMM|nr:hypothetical protein [Xenorhabdus vietnamensis]OTA15361.1 hypothetical protein Xvie_02859 [Xenorhabdus vietnamensis]